MSKKHIQVIRSYSPNATFGFVDLPSKRLYSLEQPWRNNTEGASCIPEGTYNVKRDRTGKWQYYAIQDVPDRTFIEIHPANYVRQLAGCLALGQSRMDDGFSIGSSELALKDFMEYVGEDDFLITFRSFNPAIDSLF